MQSQTEDQGWQLSQDTSGLLLRSRKPIAGGVSSKLKLLTLSTDAAIRAVPQQNAFLTVPQVPWVKTAKPGCLGFGSGFCWLHSVSGHRLVLCKWRRGKGSKRAVWDEQGGKGLHAQVQSPRSCRAAIQSRQGQAGMGCQDVALGLALMSVTMAAWNCWFGSAKEENIWTWGDEILSTAGAQELTFISWRLILPGQPGCPHSCWNTGHGLLW